MSAVSRSQGGGPRQLSFDLGHRPAHDRYDFFVTAANSQAVAFIDRWPDWPHPALIVTGAAGSGKSHLTAVWCEETGAPCVGADALSEEALPDLFAGGALAIEDVDRASCDEKLLFHALNMAREQGGWLLLTARTAPSGWPLTLADLASRLRAAPCVHLGPPDDLLLRAVLVKLFADRQLNVDVTVLDYVCRRIERSLAATADFVQRLDREALEEGRAISRNLAGRVLAAMAGGTEDRGAEADR